MAGSRSFAVALFALVNLVTFGAAAQEAVVAEGAREGDDAGTADALLPPELVRESPAQYPSDALDAGVQGAVVLELTLSEAGEVVEATVVHSEHPALSAAALAAAPGLGFRPATLGGAPIPVRLQYRYDFVPPVRSAPAPVSFLRGSVRVRGSEKPVPSAVLVRYKSEEVLAQVDSEGRFEISAPPQKLIIDVKAPGYEPFTVVENLQQGSVEVVYRLLPTGHPDPYTTLVRDDRGREERSRHTLHGRELRDVPGTMGDPFRVVMLMPGVGGIASGLSYPVVRGTQPASTAYFVDGVRIPNLYHLFVGHAVVHPELVERIDFYPGSPPANFGRVLGAVVDAKSRKISDERISAFASADLLNVGGLVAGPIGADTRFSLSGRLSYTPFILGLVATAVSHERDQLVADFMDYQARIEHRLGGGRLRLFALGAADTAGVRDLESEAKNILHQQFHRVELRYETPLSVGDASIAATWGYDSTSLESIPGDGPNGSEFSAASMLFAGRLSLVSRPSSRLTLNTGAELERRLGSNLNRLGAAGGGTIDLAAPSIQTVLAGAWSHATWRPSDPWTVTGGLRLDSYYLTPGVHHAVVEPNLSAHVQVNPSVGAMVSAGLVHQPPTVLINVPTLDYAGLKYGLQEGAQLSARLDWAPRSWLEVSVEGYYTHFTRTYEFSLFDVLQQQLDPGTTIGQEQAGTGRAYGVELMLKHPLGNGWFGWLSYSLQRSERLTRVVDLERYRADGVAHVTDQMLPFAFDQTHNLNLALSFQLPNQVTLGGVLHFHTGRPESGQITSRTARGETDADGLTRWHTLSLNRADRLPPFFRLDLRVSRFVAFSNYTVELYLDVLNATASEEVLAYEYLNFNGGELEKRPMAIRLFLPTVGVKGWLP